MTEEIKTEISTGCSYYKDVVKNEILIDGVNVAGCEFFLQDEKYSCDLSFINQEELCKCNDVQDCYYKQLKRLEQENKELKEKITSLEREIRQKKMTIMMNNDHYLTVDENNRKYHSALEEIRILATKNVSIENFVKIQNKINEVLQ